MTSAKFDWRKLEATGHKQKLSMDLGKLVLFFEVLWVNFSF